MAARIVNLARVARRQVPAPVAPGLAADLPAGLHFWRGASGRRYAHTVYSLIECPPLPRAAYLLIRRDPAGQRHVLHIGSGESSAPSLNLARLRQRGASLGANEVHVHFQAETAEQRQLVVCDLRAGQFGVLDAEPVCGHRERVARVASLET
jgi:hypothetical protein